MEVDVNEIIAFEDGTLEEGRVYSMFQKLTDSGHVWNMQGLYGRTAINLIAGGHITANMETVPPRAKQILDDIAKQKRANQMTNLMRSR